MVGIITKISHFRSSFYFFTIPSCCPEPTVKGSGTLFWVVADKLGVLVSQLPSSLMLTLTPMASLEELINDIKDWFQHFLNEHIRKRFTWSCRFDLLILEYLRSRIWEQNRRGLGMVRHFELLLVLEFEQSNSLEQSRQNLGRQLRTVCIREYLKFECHLLNF